MNGQITAWSAIFIGLYAVAAGFGEWRQTGGWERLLDELEGSRALQYITGLLCITIGALIYLANPMYGNDWLSFVLGILGGLTAVEGLLLLAVPDRVIPFAWRLLEKAGRIGPGASVAIGLALFLAGAVRV